MTFGMRLTGTIQRLFGLEFHMKMEELAGNLSILTGRPVIDQTNLTGRYAFDLRWDREDELGLIAQFGKLGLKLESRKMPIEMFVVDKVNREPTGN